MGQNQILILQENQVNSMSLPQDQPFHTPSTIFGIIAVDASTWGHHLMKPFVIDLNKDPPRRIFN